MRWEETAIGDGTLGVLGPGEQRRLDCMVDLFDALDVYNATDAEKRAAVGEWLNDHVPSDALEASMRFWGFADLLPARSA